MQKTFEKAADETPASFAKRALEAIRNITEQGRIAFVKSANPHGIPTVHEVGTVREDVVAGYIMYSRQPNSDTQTDSLLARNITEIGDTAFEPGPAVSESDKIKENPQFQAVPEPSGN